MVAQGYTLYTAAFRNNYYYQSYCFEKKRERLHQVGMHDNIATSLSNNKGFEIKYLRQYLKKNLSIWQADDTLIMISFDGPSQ